MSGRVKTILTLFFSLCGLALVVDPFIPKTHAHYPWETWPEFYGAYGFVSCVVLVLIAKYGLRPAVMRDEDYYDD